MKGYLGSLVLTFLRSKYVDKLGRGKEVRGHLSDSTHDARPPLPVNADHQRALETVTSRTAAGLGWSNSSARQLKGLSLTSTLGVSCPR